MAEPRRESVTRRRQLMNDWLPLLTLILLVLVGWEVIKLIGGSPIRVHEFLGQPVEWVYQPPLKFRFANDLNMPHIWDIFGAFGRPATRNGPPLILPVIEAAFFTFRVALIGFALGTAIGLAIAILLVYSRLLNRALVPYIIASQTVPILVIAPIVVIWLRAGWFSIAIIAAYLTFFPVTISALRGLQSIRPEMLELMETYAASPWQTLIKLRLPAALPYLFVGFKIAATASIIGTIVGELPSGISDGLGIAVLSFAQYYTTAPAKLWATILVAATLGISAFVLVHLAETWFLRHRALSSDE
jgi:NitT/TauT family transport system permease protein